MFPLVSQGKTLGTEVPDHVYFNTVEGSFGLPLASAATPEEY